MNYTQVNIYTKYLSLDGGDIVLRFPNVPPEGSFIRTRDLFENIMGESRIISNYNLINDDVQDVDEIIDVSGQQTIRFPLDGLISKTSVSNSFYSHPWRGNVAWSHGNMTMDPLFYYLRKDSDITSYSISTPFSADKWILPANDQSFSDIQDKVKVFDPKNLIYVAFPDFRIPALRDLRFPVETTLPSTGELERSEINRYAFNVPEACYATHAKIQRVFIDPQNEGRITVSFNSVVVGKFEIKLRDIPDEKKTREVINNVHPDMLIKVDINYRMTTSVDKKVKLTYPVKDDAPYFISGQNIPELSTNEKSDFIIDSRVIPNTNDQQFQLNISYHGKLQGFQTFGPGRIKIILDVNGESSEFILKRTTTTPYDPLTDREEYISDTVVYDANSFNQAAYVLSLALNAPKFAILNSSRKAHAKKTYFNMIQEGDTYKRYSLEREPLKDLSPAVKSLRATITPRPGSDYAERIQYDLIVDRSKDPGFLGENNTFYLHREGHEANMNMIINPMVVKESGDLIWLRGYYNANEIDDYISQMMIYASKHHLQATPLSISGSKPTANIEDDGVVYDYVAPFDDETAKINGQPFLIADVSQVTITYDSVHRTGTMVVKTSRPITGPIRFGLSGIPRNKVVGFNESDLNSDIIFTATGNGGTTFTMPLNASHFKIKAGDLEKLVFANNQWTAYFKSNLTGNVQIDISTVHAEYEDDFLRNTRRSSASRRFSFTLNNSRTSTTSAAGWQYKHSLYGNIVYAWVGNEQVKFFAIIDESDYTVLLLPYAKAQELNLIPDLHLIVNFNSDGPITRVAGKGTNGRFAYSTRYSNRVVANDDAWIEVSSQEEEFFSYLVSAVNNTEEHYILYSYLDGVTLPEGHPDREHVLTLNAKVIRANKTEFQFQPKKTFNMPTAIVTGKSLFEVPQEIFDKGLIEGFILGDNNSYIDHPVTFKAGLLPSDIKRMVQFDVMSNINPAKSLFSVYTYDSVTGYYRNTIDNAELLIDPRELGQHRIVLRVHGGYTEERFINITAVRKVNEGGVDKYYINISPKGVQATQPFNINLIESVNFTPNSDKTGGTLKVTFKSSIEGRIQFALKDVPDDKKFDIVEKLLDPNVEYQTTASNARSIDIPVSKREFVRVKPSDIYWIEYSENQWQLMVKRGNCGYLSATISDQSGIFEEDFLASSQANTESGRTIEFASLSGLGGANLITIPASASHNSNNTLYGNVVYIWLNGERKRFVADIKSNGDVKYTRRETGSITIFPVDCFDVMINSDKAVISHSGNETQSDVHLSGIPNINAQLPVTIAENYGTLRNQLDNFIANGNGNYVEYRYGGEMRRYNMHLEKVNKTQYRYKIQKNPAEFSNQGVVKGNSLFDIPQESMKKSLFKTITYGNGQPPVIEIDSQNISGSFSRYVRTKIYSKVNPNNVIMTIEAEPNTADRYISVNSTLTSGDTSELGDHRMTFELSDGYIEERRVNLSFIENAGLGRYKMTFAAVGQIPKTKKEILFEKVKSEIVGFRREYNSNTQTDDLQLIFKNEQHSSIYIRALNVNGLIGRHERIEGQWDASEWTDEINQLFTDGPYGPFVDIALSQNNTDDNPDDTIWVKFYRLPLTPHQYNLVPTGNESEYGKMLSFTCLRFDTSGNNEISLVVADTADTTTSYSAIPSAAALPSNGRLGDVKVLDTFFPINTKNDTFSSINQSIQVSTTYVGGIETRSFNNLVPPALLSGKYTARGTNVAQLANRILSGMRVLFQLGPDYPKMLVYPVVNGNYIDFYPYKVGDNKVAIHPQAGQIIDWLINRGLNNVPESTANGVSRDAFTRPVTGLPTNITVPGEESLDSFLSKIREKINAFNEGTSPRAIRNAYVKEVLSRVGLSDSNLYPLFEQTPVTIASAPQPKIISINDVLHNDLNNIVPTNNPDRATLHPGSIDRNTELDILRGGLDRGENLANTYRDFANKLNDAITSIRNTEASNVVNPQTGKPLLPPTVNPAGTVIHMDGENAFNHRITPATRPTKPAQTSVKPVKQEYNDKADAYNRYLDALKDRYGYNFDAYKVADTDKFNLARPYVVDMPSTQYGNPEFDKPIDGATPGDLIGFIAEMVYGIQNDRTRNVLETIPGIYIPAVIPAEFRYLGRKDDVIKNQFIRVLNKWIELKPKNGLIREEQDAFYALVDELIILSDNPITQSGLEDGSVYSLSTLFKGSLLNQDE